ncbi:MAG: hypothetical protein J6B09_01965 [Clostridia bacterium]|nr:hypothetical protein [Clostridia bacterium]
MKELDKNEISSLDDAVETLENEETEIEEEDEKNDTVIEKSGTFWRERMKKALPYVAIYARYLLPLLTGVLLLGFSFLDWVYFYMQGSRYKMSLFSFYQRTLTSSLDYVGGKTTDQANGFYGMLSAGAVVGILFYLVALFFAVLAALTAIRAFRAGHESKESNRMKVAFKIAFPNRVCLFLSNVLFLVPALFPEYFSAVGRHFMLVDKKEIIYTETNILFFVILGLTLITLALALAIPRLERQKKMNMFLIFHPDEDEEDEEEDEEE